LEKSNTNLVAKWHLCLSQLFPLNASDQVLPLSKTETGPVSKAYRLNNVKVLKPIKSHLQHADTGVQNEAVLAHQRCVETTDIQNETLLNHHPFMGETEAKNGSSN
jgi:hypothetical protein